MEFSAEALYFQARENGVSYAIVKDRVEHPAFNSRFGGRLSLAIPLGHDCWTLSAAFLHYHARNRDTIQQPVLPSWGHQTASPFVDNLWRLHMGIGDLFLSRGWSVSPCLTLTPRFGLSYAMIRHKLLIEYETVDLSMKDKFWGVGSLMGVEGAWGFWRCLSLVGRGSLRLWPGEVYLHQDEGKQIKLYSSYDTIQAGWEGALGLMWGWRCLEALLSYEVHLYPSINQLLRTCDLSMVGKVYGNQGDLSLHGLSFGLAIQF